MISGHCHLYCGKRNRKTRTTASCLTCAPIHCFFFPSLIASIEPPSFLSLTHFLSPSREVELLLLEERELWPAEEGWLTFDLTATTNLWLEHPGQNLGLHLVLEDSRSECSANLRKDLLAERTLFQSCGEKKKAPVNLPRRFFQSSSYGCGSADPIWMNKRSR